MTNLQKVSENHKRLNVLENRRQRLIALNKENDYVTMIFKNGNWAGNPRDQQYTKLLSEIRIEKFAIWQENRKLDLNYADRLEDARQAVVSMNKDLLFALTSPSYV